ncbi:MAG: allophanate hydrolase [Methylomonas sp.]|jgi:allophanate hydrolase|uniref:allophanate hydrolase n=1 Tax=Methylomonas sp. TaxID=418 RepID=UPI0025FC805B|nr:allophanate hydrolase [Methylomonas sp.]MCK9607401.1 allophanate hydrolase [Methylomonas sp.]
MLTQSERLDDLSISGLRQLYLRKSLSPSDLIDEIHRRIARTRDYNIWIHVLDRRALTPYLENLAAQDPESLPLYGIPFAIKDNIDLAGEPTTAGCPAFEYRAEHSSTVVAKLIGLGAIPIGKTNLDQFATGLVGTRSPYGPCKNSFDPSYIAGGSSSGSAVAVALGQASFALGTDTAGSGRVPAAFNNLIGYKPTRGLLSTAGVVPACKTLDCVNLFTLSVEDTQHLAELIVEYDPLDDYSREQPVSASKACTSFNFGVPQQEQLRFFGNDDAATLFQKAVERFEQMGGHKQILDCSPLFEAAQLLYQGPWLAERYAALADIIEQNPEALHPLTRSIIEPAARLTAVDAFNAFYRLQALKRQADALLNPVDFMLTPTAGTIYTIDQITQNPIELNSNLGYYTNFMNLLDFAALALPSGFDSNGLPNGITLFSRTFEDSLLMAYGKRYMELSAINTGAPTCHAQAVIEIAVCGAHLSGLPLNHQLTDRGAKRLARTQTAPRYRLFALTGSSLGRPGLVRDETYGAAIEIEVWSLPIDRFGSFVAAIPHPLGMGKIETAGGSWVAGFICEAYVIQDAEEITAFGGWRSYCGAQGGADNTE